MKDLNTKKSVIPKVVKQWLDKIAPEKRSLAQNPSENIHAGWHLSFYQRRINIAVSTLLVRDFDAFAKAKKIPATPNNKLDFSLRMLAGLSKVKKGSRGHIQALKHTEMYGLLNSFETVITDLPFYVQLKLVVKPRKDIAQEAFKQLILYECYLNIEEQINKISKETRLSKNRQIKLTNAKNQIARKKQSIENELKISFWERFRPLIGRIVNINALFAPFLWVRFALPFALVKLFQHPKKALVGVYQNHKNIKQTIWELSWAAIENSIMLSMCLIGGSYQFFRALCAISMIPLNLIIEGLKKLNMRPTVLEGVKIGLGLIGFLALVTKILPLVIMMAFYGVVVYGAFALLGSVGAVLAHTIFNSPSIQSSGSNSLTSNADTLAVVISNISPEIRPGRFGLFFSKINTIGQQVKKYRELNQNDFEKLPLLEKALILEKMDISLNEIAISLLEGIEALFDYSLNCYKRDFKDKIDGHNDKIKRIKRAQKKEMAKGKGSKVPQSKSLTLAKKKEIAYILNSWKSLSQLNPQSFNAQAGEHADELKKCSRNPGAILFRKAKIPQWLVTLNKPVFPITDDKNPKILKK